MPLTARDRLSDLLARVVVGTLFVLLSINLFADYQRTHHVTGLLLLLSEALVVVLTIFRRRAQVVDRTIAAAVVTALSLVGPPLLRAGGVPWLPDLVTAILSIVGVCFVIAGKAVLGRSFGLIPANRGVVARGPYALMRHPIYAGYLLTHAGFIAAHPTLWNVAVIVVADAMLIVRALMEERVLCQDEQYRSYCAKVGWHLVPGVF